MLMDVDIEIWNVTMHIFEEVGQIRAQFDCYDSDVFNCDTGFADRLKIHLSCLDMLMR